MFLKRNPWLIPIVVVLVVAGLYLTFVTSRSTIDQPELLGTGTIFAAIFVAFAAIALFAYRALRRSRATMDEARSKQR
jgi:cellobiose-specific phosphotransferase system component IIC